MSSSIFIPRTTSPPEGDPYWISNRDNWGGYNKYPIQDQSDGDTLPNCTAYAEGRWMELLNLTSTSLYLADANLWFGHRQDGYARGQEPKLGAIICWDTDSRGHVGVVEKIGRDVNGNITVIHVSYSAYHGARFTYRNNIYPPLYKYKNNCTLQGFIYSPIEFLETDYAAILAAAKPKRKQQFRKLH